MPKIIPEYNVRYESERRRLYKDVAEQTQIQFEKWEKEYGRARALVLYKKFTITINYPSRHKRGQEFSSYRPFKDLESFENFLREDRYPRGGGPLFSPYEIIPLEEYEEQVSEGREREVLATLEGQQGEYVKVRTKKAYIGQEELEVSISIPKKMGKKVVGITKYWKGKIINQK